jgi:probable HAF family extracellular repeat protein
MVLAPSANAAYTFTVLDTRWGGASAINNAGQVVGVAHNGIPYPYSSHATLWDGTIATDLGVPGERSSSASAINDFGQVAGQVVDVDWGYHATVWNGTTVTDLGGGAAYAINNAGQVAGESGGGATVWNGTTATYLGAPPGGTSSRATAINDAGQVAGDAYTTDYASTMHATLWNGTTATDLGTLGGSQSHAYGINNAGQVVGSSFITGNVAFSVGYGGIASHATLWSGATATDLGTLAACRT